jgi:Cu(I)/Ag(I) efflux system membrane fusion protein
MKRNIIVLVGFAAAIAAGIGIGRYSITPASLHVKAGAETSREILYWVAPMDPNFRRPKPGKSPMGMDLVPVYADEIDARPGVVKIDPAIVANLGVRAAAAEYGPLSRMIETVGYVGYDEQSLIHIHTRVDGWIEKLAVSSLTRRKSFLWRYEAAMPRSTEPRGTG